MNEANAEIMRQVTACLILRYTAPGTQTRRNTPRKKIKSHVRGLTIIGGNIPFNWTYAQRGTIQSFSAFRSFSKIVVTKESNKGLNDYIIRAIHSVTINCYSQKN